MDVYVFAFVLYVHVHLLKGDAAPPTLNVDVNDVFVNSSVTFTCSTSTPPTYVAWYKTDKGSTTDKYVITQEWVEGTKTCFTDNNNMQCSCKSSQVYTCSINSVTFSNEGQRWYCQASINNVHFNSNSYTFRLLFPPTSLTIDPQTSVAYPVFNVASTFTCITSTSRPQAIIHWFNDGVNITDLAEYSYSNDVAISRLLYTPNTYAYSGGNLSCIASYEFKAINTVLTTNKSIKVQFPVSKPIVTVNNISITSTFNIREGRLVHLNCSSSGYPPPSYQWTYPGGHSVGDLLSLKFTRNNGSISCRVFHFMYSLNGTNSTQSTEKMIALDVNALYPPSIIRLFNKDIGLTIVDSNIRVQRGDNISIVCESDANPPAMIFWKGQQVNSSTLTITIIQHDTEWTCKATNTMTEADGTTSTETVTRNLSATVLYGPVVPTITYSILPHSDKSWIATNETIRVIVGSTVRLMCSVDSVPTSIYSWDSGHDGSIRNISNITFATDKNYTCMVKNIMDTTFKGNVSGSNHSSVNLNLLYGPENINANFNNINQIDQVLKVIKGWSFTIACFATSNPAPSFSWHGPGAPEGNVLSITNASTDMDRNLTCDAVNTMVDSVGHIVNETVRLTITLDILYPPAVQGLQNQSALLNASLTVTCSLTNVGNPPASIFTWIRKDTNTVVGTGQTLTINNIELTDEGEYQCNASNKMQPIGNEVVYGFGQSTFYINVEYGAYIRAFKANESITNITVDQGETLELVCEADGDPQPTVRIVNATRENETILVETEAHKAKSHIQRATCEYDAGSYKCLANNRFNHGQHKQSLTLFVNCAPRASPFSPPITEQYRAPNDSAVFTFTIMAYPEPKSSDFLWYKRVDDEWKDVSSDSNNFLINTSDDNMQTQLMILRVQFGDYADYMVNVSNTLGSVAQVFNLHAQSKPYVPKDLLIDRVGKTDIGITWVPGFNGGQDQNFTVRYKEVEIEIWRDIYVAGSVMSYTLTIGGLKPGTTYQIKMLAENKIGKSEWTKEITETTLVDAVDNGSAAPAIGGAIGAAAGVVIIVAVIVVIWRYRTRALQKSDAKQILTRRSIKHAKGTYENTGMLAPNHEKKTTKRAPASSRPGNKCQSSREQAHTLATHVSKNNIQRSEKHAVKSAPVKYEKYSLQNSEEKPAPEFNDIQGLQKIAGKSIPLTDKVQSSQTHETVIVDPIATPPKDKSVLQRRDSFSIEHDPIYDNLYKTKKPFKHREISVQNLRETVVGDKDNKADVFTEYSALNVVSEKIKYSTNAALKPANTSKNRYKNMYPYDKNRVTLAIIGNDIDTDFINASFIDGYFSPKKYIAAQGPLAGTRADLWRLIWEKNVRVVVMVTNLVEESKRKCFQYWPTGAGNDCQYGDFTIHLLEEETYADFVIRTLQCTRTGSSKNVTHLHFTSWPDKDVPDTALSLMQFWRKVRSVEKPVDAPWIVHCSAGVGRTGTFIALDYLYDQGVSEKQINVFNAVLLLREQRINMVQTKNQYLYLHEVLGEALCPVGEVLSNKAYLENKRASDYLNQEYQTICQSHIPDCEEEAADGDYIKVLDGEKPENMSKNVDPCVVPDDKYRPVLNAINTRGHTDYINGVYVSTFQEGGRLILTQSAKASSDIDFVRLLHDHYVQTVVTLSDQMEPYLPESGESIVIGPFTASSISCAQKQHFQEYVVRFKHIGERESFDVQVFRFTKWSKQLDLCKTNELLSLLTDVQERASTQGPVGIQCSDGYSRSGLVAVLWCLMERSKRDGEVAVAETVRMIRRRREQVITNEAQYRLCHEFMKEYVEGCLVYANT